MILQIAGSYIYFPDFENNNIADYIRYIIDIISYVINTNTISINIIIGNDTIHFNNNNRTIKINYNIEHNLVLRGGRGTTSACPVGTISTLDGVSHYLVRIDNSSDYDTCDIMIDYSVPNITNIKSCAQYEAYFKKMIYISPRIYDTYRIDKTNRDIDVLTTFINTNEPRRKALLENMDIESIPHINVNNCFDKQKLKELLSRTKIIVNIHQTDHHHTFEELRVLPALLCGVIVISEESPLKEQIPYHNMIVWTTYDNILATIKDVQDNYDTYYSNLFNADSELLFSRLHENNINVLKESIQ